MPMTSPGRVSKTSTPVIAATAARKSGLAATRIRRGRSPAIRYSRRRVATSTSSITAAITTAARVASGSFSKRPVRKSRVTIVSTPTTRPEIWLLAPAPPLTAVFESEPLTTIPLDSPAARLAEPRPSSSALASTV